MPPSTTCTLRVVRGARYADKFRRYKIFVDGVFAGTIARDSALDLEMPCGERKIQARIDWGRSPPLLIEVAPNKRNEVEILNPWTGWRSLLLIWAATFGYRSYLKLRQL